VRLRCRIEGSPVDGLTLSSNVVYDGLAEHFSRGDASLVADYGPVLAALRVDWLDVAGDADGEWRYRPRLAFTAGRYDLDSSLELREGGRSLDRWSIDAQRNLVDGRLGLRYERSYDENGDLDDERFMIVYGLDGLSGALDR
jgi:hypothetical protein